MPIDSELRNWLGIRAPGTTQTRVLLADHDPISRHVLGAVLRAAGGVDGSLTVVCCLDSLIPIQHWPRLDWAEIVVLSVVPGEDPTQTIRELISRGIRVLLVAAHWDEHSLDRAVAAGATGCLIKDTEVGKLAAAAHAVASGYLLLSPELLDIYRSVPRQDCGSPPANQEQHRQRITEREYEVLSLLAEGMSTTEAARALRVSPATVKSHVSHTLPKLGARNRLEAVLMISGTLRSVSSEAVPRQGRQL